MSLTTPVKERGVEVYSKFEGTDLEKQNAILNAALKEFALRGFKQASTNQIVKDAGISKGLLFHYFNNKKDLYLFLYDHFVQMFLHHIKARIDWNVKDIFIRNRQMAALKLEMFRQYPEAFSFLSTVFKESDPEVKPEVELRSKQFMSNEYLQMVSDVDVSKFKDGLDVKKAIQIIAWSMEGFAYQQQNKLRGRTLDPAQLEEALVEMDAYVEVLKQVFYK